MLIREERERVDDDGSFCRREYLWDGFLTPNTITVNHNTIIFPRKNRVK